MGYFPQKILFLVLQEKKRGSEGSKNNNLATKYNNKTIYRKASILFDFWKMLLASGRAVVPQTPPYKYIDSICACYLFLLLFLFVVYNIPTP